MIDFLIPLTAYDGEETRENRIDWWMSQETSITLYKILSKEKRIKK